MFDAKVNKNQLWIRCASTIYLAKIIISITLNTFYFFVLYEPGVNIKFALFTDPLSSTVISVQFIVYSLFSERVLPLNFFFFDYCLSCLTH